jgi:hypothetical protein
MNNETQQTQSHNTKGKASSPEQIAVVDAKPKTIPVKTLTFFQSHPSFNARTSISAEQAANKGRVTIEFVPGLRHHKVESTLPGQPAKVVYVYEGHVASFEPL